MKRSHRYYSEMDYFPITARPVVIPLHFVHQTIFSFIIERHFIRIQFIFILKKIPETR